jgi:hypothetical protein
MHSLHTILSKLIKDYGLEGGIVLRAIHKQWKDIVGHAIASHTSPLELKSKLLTINVDSPQWMHHLGFFKEEMLDKLKSYKIEQIRFKLGKVTAQTHEETSSLERNLSDDDLRYIENTLKDVKDTELRETFRKLIVHGLRKGKEQNQ